MACASCAEGEGEMRAALCRADWPSPDNRYWPNRPLAIQFRPVMERASMFPDYGMVPTTAQSCRTMASALPTSALRPFPLPLAESIYATAGNETQGCGLRDRAGA